MPQTPIQAAEVLYASMPHGLSPDTLMEYGIEASPEQASRIAREMLSLNLYWIRSALEASLSQKNADRVFGELQQSLLKRWQSELGLQGYDPQVYFKEMKERRAVYDRVMQEGGSPVSVCMEAARILEFERAVPTEDRPKLLALFIDLVPVETFGEMVAEFDLSG
ncbi:MAG: hypothetical protein C4293_01065 [Nitrospiraceae bacterium]